MIGMFTQIIVQNFINIYLEIKSRANFEYRCCLTYVGVYRFLYDDFLLQECPSFLEWIKIEEQQFTVRSVVIAQCVYMAFRLFSKCILIINTVRIDWKISAFHCISILKLIRKIHITVSLIFHRQKFDDYTYDVIKVTSLRCNWMTVKL